MIGKLSDGETLWIATVSHSISIVGDLNRTHNTNFEKPMCKTSPKRGVVGNIICTLWQWWQHIEVKTKVSTGDLQWIHHIICCRYMFRVMNRFKE